MLKVNWDAMSCDEKIFVKDLIRASVGEIVRQSDLDILKAHGVPTSIHDVKKLEDDTRRILGHIYNPRCLMNMANENFRCRKIDNYKMTPDNIVHVFKPLPNDYSMACLSRLV